MVLIFKKCLWFLFQKDFMLMCNNAMTYNRPETVYYKEAKRLLHIGIKQLSKVSNAGIVERLQD